MHRAKLGFTAKTRAVPLCCFQHPIVDISRPQRMVAPEGSFLLIKTRIAQLKMHKHGGSL
eukprot:1144421-Pelagomonas_calceolata.AAC.4